jgi:hypothetical protein
MPPLLALLVAAALAQPVPQPFPRTGPPAPAPATAEPPPAADPATPVDPGPDEATLGAPVYPGAQFIASYDAGRGQRFYLYGTAASFVTTVGYYRNVLKNRGELVFEAPATHQFDIGRFREQTMAFPPSVTIKDFESAVSKGYPTPRPGVAPAQFRTVIQIVPVVPEPR